MPLYVYVCRTCAAKVEQLRSFVDRLEPATCPECASEARFALSLSAPSFVGTAAGASCGENREPGSGCCGGGACGMN